MKVRHVAIDSLLKGQIPIGRDQLAPIDDAMPNQLVRHMAFCEGEVYPEEILLDHENPQNKTAGAILVKHRERWFLGVAHDCAHENAVVRFHLDMVQLFGSDYSNHLYVLRDRATRYYMNQPLRRSENDYAVVRGPLELGLLQVILKPGQFHFFEIILVSRDNPEAFAKVMARKLAGQQGSMPFDYASLGALDTATRTCRGSHYRFFSDGMLERERTSFRAGREHPVESDGRFSYFVAGEIGPYLRELGEKGDYDGEIQIYNIKGRNISFEVKNESCYFYESIDLNQPGSILLKNVTEGTRIDFKDLDGADFLIHQYEDPDWYIDRGHQRFSDAHLDTVDDSCYRSGESLIQLGILVVTLSNENDIDYDPNEGGKVTPWVHVPGQRIRRGEGGKDEYPSAAASLVRADSRTSNTIPESDLMIYGDRDVGVYPSELLHHHLTENWSHGNHEEEVRPLELYHVAEGGMGLFVRINQQSGIEKEYLLHLVGGDTVVVDPFVIHGIAYIDTPYSHVVVQIPGVWDLAKLGGRFKHGVDDMRELLNRRPRLRENILRAMSDRNGGAWEVGDDFAKLVL